MKQEFRYQQNGPAFSYQRSNTFFVSDGAGELSGIWDLNIVNLQPLFLAVDLQLDTVAQLNLFPVLEPLGDGVTLAKFNLEAGLLLSGSDCQRLNLFGELWWQFWKWVKNGI